MPTTSSLPSSRRQATAMAVTKLLTNTGRKSKAQPRPAIQFGPREIGPVEEPNVNDVLCGRGGRINAHPGNVSFRERVQQSRVEYLDEATKKLEKAHIAARIVQEVRDLDPPGRFLKQDADTGFWWDIGCSKAMKKCGQAMREDAQEFKKAVSPDEQLSFGKQPASSPVAAKRPPVRVELNCPASPGTYQRSSTPPPHKREHSDHHDDQIMPPAKRQSPNSSPGSGYEKPYIVDLRQDMAPPSVRRNSAGRIQVPSLDTSDYHEYSAPTNSGSPNGNKKAAGYYSRVASDYMAQPPPLPSADLNHHHHHHHSHHHQQQQHPFHASNSSKLSTDNVFGRMFHPPSKVNGGSHVSAMSDISGVPENSVVSGISSLTAGDTPMRGSWEHPADTMKTPQVVTSLPPMMKTWAEERTPYPYARQRRPSNNNNTNNNVDSMSVGDMSLSVANMSLDMDTATAVSWSKLT